MFRHIDNAHTANTGATTVPAFIATGLPSMLDWLVLTLPAPLVVAVSEALTTRYAAAARRRLQQEAAAHLSRGSCSLMARLIVAGEWAALDRLLDAVEGRTQ